MKKIVILLAALCASAGFANVARAGFDVVVFDDVSSAGGSLHFHGPTYVGGDVLNNGSAPEFGNDAGDTIDGYSLVVAGSYLRPDGNINNNSKVLYGGTRNTSNDASMPWYAAKFVHDDSGKIASYGIDKQNYLDMSQSYLSSTSETISSLVGMSFTANGKNDVQYYNMSENIFETFANNSFTFGSFSDSGDSIVINVSGKDIYMNSAANFNNPGVFSSQITWNFYEATSLNLKDFYGNVLAPNAAYVQRSQNLHGKLVCDSISGDGQIHTGGDFPETPTPTPTVPAPSAIALAAFGLVSAARRKFIR